MDWIREDIKVSGYEKVTYAEHKPTGLRSIIAIHNTNRGVNKSILHRFSCWSKLANRDIQLSIDYVLWRPRMTALVRSSPRGSSSMTLPGGVSSTTFAIRCSRTPSRLAPCIPMIIFPSPFSKTLQS